MSDKIEPMEPTYQCPYCDVEMIEVDCGTYYCNSCSWGNCDSEIGECIEFVNKCLEKYRSRLEAGMKPPPLRFRVYGITTIAKSKLYKPVDENNYFISGIEVKGKEACIQLANDLGFQAEFVEAFDV